jgi:hypothetical protein
MWTWNTATQKIFLKSKFMHKTRNRANSKNFNFVRPAINIKWGHRCLLPLFLHCHQNIIFPLFRQRTTLNNKTALQLHFVYLNSAWKLWLKPKYPTMVVDLCVPRMLFVFIPMGKLVLNYKSSSGNNSSHEMRPPCTWKMPRNHKKKNQWNKNSTYHPPVHWFCGWSQ